MSNTVAGGYLDTVFADAWDRVKDDTLSVMAHVAPAELALVWPDAFHGWWMPDPETGVRTGCPQQIKLRDLYIPPWDVSPGFDLAWSVDGVTGRTWRERWRNARKMPPLRQVYLTLWDSTGRPLAPVPAIGTVKRDGGAITLAGVVTETRGVTGVHVTGAFMKIH